jgi:alpha-L-arabinofuranosidase
MNILTFARTITYGAFLFSSPLIVLGQQAKITVDASKVLNRISPVMYGSCIEDVNHEIYGGLYDQRLFGESFEEPAPSMRFKGWKTFGGSWKLSGQNIKIDPGPGYKLICDQIFNEKVTVQADIKITEGFNAGLIVNVANEKNGADDFDGYEVSINPKAQTIILGKHQQNWKPLFENKISFDPGNYVAIRIVINGPRLQVFANNNEVPAIDYTDRDRPLKSGKIGLRTFNARAEFKNLVVTESQQQFKREFKAEKVPDISSVWRSFETGIKGSYALDANNAFTGKQSQILQRNNNKGKTGVSNMGLNQWGIALQRGEKMEGAVYLKASGLEGPVTLALQNADGSVTYASQQIKQVTESWKKYTFNLTPRQSDPKARFVLYIENSGKLWVDQATLMSTGQNQFKGLPLRADIAEKMQNQGLNFLRYGGTMVNSPEYRWKNMKGERDLRPPYKGHWYPYSSNGFGIDEFVKFCESAGFEPAFAINIEETPQDAIDMVEHFKGRIKYIEIGNEEVIFDGPTTWSAGYSHYIERFNILYEAIHAKDPSIKLINAAWWRPELSDMEKVFKALNGKAAFWDLHTDADQANSGTTVDRNLSHMNALFHKWDPNTTMKCTIFEENGGLHNMQRALGHATTLNATRRHGDFLLTSCPANALQALGQNDNGWDQGQIFFTPDQVWAMPPFYAQQMAAKNHMPLRITESVDGDLDVTATKSDDDKTLVIHVVNTGAIEINTSINILKFTGRRPAVQIFTLAGDLNTENTAQDPERIKTVEKTQVLNIKNPVYKFTPHSYTILRFEK